nr:PREDICTED: uncharacterized protein LOC105663774 [Megachile rotundata]
MSISGKLLPHAFLCMQEPTGKFGPTVQKEVEKSKEGYKNVIVTSSKSGKLTNELYKSFLKSVIQPYVEDKKFLLIIDSCGGQTNMQMYDDLFTTDEGDCTYTVKVVLPKCMPLIQSCDVYFYRQVKNFLKKIQNCCHLLVMEFEREISTREDDIKLHSLIHNQLYASIFVLMLKYA